MNEPKWGDRVKYQGSVHEIVEIPNYPPEEEDLLLIVSLEDDDLWGWAMKKELIFDHE